jgi:Na+/melibiose symporter-like transporter
MNNTQFIILLVVVVIAIIATAFTVNSCNENPEDTSKLQELIIRHLNKSDSLQKVALDSMLAISQRDSAHNVTIHNIFNTSNKNIYEITKNKPDSNRVRSILNWADSLANRYKLDRDIQPNTGF